MSLLTDAEIALLRQESYRQSMGVLSNNLAFARAIEAATAAKYAERIAELEAKLDAAAVDAERLNHIEQNARCDPKMDGQHVWWPTSFNRALKGPTLRDAIDASKGDHHGN